jgi:hypothetical protein
MQQSSVAQAEWIVFSSMNQQKHEMSNALARLGSSGSMAAQQPNSDIEKTPSNAA